MKKNFAVSVTDVPLFLFSVLKIFRASHRENKRIRSYSHVEMFPHRLNYARRRLERCHFLRRHLDIKLSVRRDSCEDPEISSALRRDDDEHPFDAPRRKLGRHRPPAFICTRKYRDAVVAAHLSFARYRGVTNQLVS